MTASYDLYAVIAGIVLSLCAFSLIFGDNGLFRLAASLLTGALSGYFCIFLGERVFIPLLSDTLLSGSATAAQRVMAVIVCVAAVMLFLKVYTRTRNAGSKVMTILASISAAVLVTGAAVGLLPGLLTGLTSRFQVNLLPEAERTDPVYWVKTAVIIISALLSLFYTAHYGYFKKNAEPAAAGAEDAPAKRGFLHSFTELLIGFTFGAIFAGCLITAAVALVDVIQNLGADIIGLLP